MSWTFGLSGTAVFNAGLNANSTITISGSALDAWSDEAEGMVDTMTRRTWKDDSAKIPATIKQAIDQIVDSFVAMRIVTWDPTGYLRREADLLMNFNDDRITKGLKVLEDFKTATLRSAD